MQRNISIIICLLLCCSQLKAQNLVPNPSFEDYNNCPSSISNGYPIAYSPAYHNFPTALYWVTPLITTPDYFNICDTTKQGHGVPDNSAGFQIPHSGNAYAGMGIWQLLPIRCSVQAPCFGLNR
jgi:OOP family OmpA-OmpF porin